MYTATTILLDRTATDKSVSSLTASAFHECTLNHMSPDNGLGTDHLFLHWKPEFRGKKQVLGPVQNPENLRDQSNYRQVH